MNEEKPWSTGRPADAVNRKTVPDEMGSQEKVVVKKLLSKTRSRSKFRFARALFDLVLGRGLIGWVVGFVADHIRFGDFGAKNKSVRSSAGSHTRTQKPPPPGNRNVETVNLNTALSGSGRSMSKRRPVPTTNSSRIFASLVGVTACIGLFLVFRGDENTPDQDKNEWETLARSVVYIEGENSIEMWSGSGTLIIDGSYILTNFHVAPGNEGEYAVYFTESFEQAPSEGYSAEYVVGDEYNDLAILRIIDSGGNPKKISGRKIVKPSASEPELSEELTIIGYPGAGFSDSEITMTISRGSYSGKIRFGDEYFKTDGMVSGGVSGGAAFDSRGEFIGVPSASNQDEDFNSAVGLIKPSEYVIDLISKVKP